MIGLIYIWLYDINTGTDRTAKDRAKFEKIPVEFFDVIVIDDRHRSIYNLWKQGYDATVNKNFQEWVFGKQAGKLKFSEEQKEWLRMIKDHIGTFSTKRI